MVLPHNKIFQAIKCHMEYYDSQNAMTIDSEVSINEVMRALGFKYDSHVEPDGRHMNEFIFICTNLAHTTWETWYKNAVTNNQQILRFIKVLNNAKSGGWLISLQDNTTMTYNELIVLATPSVYTHLKNCRLKDDKQTSKVE